MKNKILSLIAVSLSSLNVNAAIHPSNSPSILIDSLSTPDVTVKKDTDSINMNKKISFDVRIYSESVEGNSDEQKVGVYSKDSDIVKALSESKYTLEQNVKMNSYEGVTSLYSNTSNIPINKSMELFSKKDGSIETKFIPDYISIGNNIAIDKRLDVMSIKITESKIDKWRKYNSEFGAIDLPMLFNWSMSQKIKVEEGKVIVLESPVYKTDGKLFKTIYLIESKEIK